MRSLLLSSTFGADGEGIVVFGLSIRYYAIVIVCGMILAAALSALLMKRRNISPSFIFTLFVFCIPSAIVGARLFSCLTDGSLQTMQFGAWFVRMVSPPWEGLSITGGVIGGVLAGFIVCRVCKVEFLRAADCVVINILIGQICGRWGNFFNGEVYGGVVTDPALQWFPFAVPIVPNMGGMEAFEHLSQATWHYAFFFYEMLFNLIGWAILFAVAWRRTKKPNGILTFLYFVWYGCVRACMEPLRAPQYILNGGGVMWSELFAILMVGFGVIGILVLLIVNFKREDAFVGSRKGDPCGITKYLSSDKKEKPYYSKINLLGAAYPVKPEKKKGGEPEEDGEPGEGKDPPKGEDER